MKQSINEVRRMQVLAGIIQEETTVYSGQEQEIGRLGEEDSIQEDGINSDREQIKAWYTKSNPWIDQLSQEEKEEGIQAHYEEWMASKEHYDDIEDYFIDVKNSKDWY